MFLAVCVLVSLFLSYFFYSQYENINEDFLSASNEAEQNKAKKILFEKRLKEVEKSERELIKKLKKEKFKKIKFSGDYCTSGKEIVLVNAKDGILSAWGNLPVDKPFDRNVVEPSLSGVYHVLDKDSISLSTVKAERIEDIKNTILKIISLENGQVSSFSANDSDEGEQTFSLKSCRSIKNISKKNEIKVKFGPEYCSRGDSIFKVKFVSNSFKVYKLSNANSPEGLPLEGGEVISANNKQAFIKIIFSNQEEVNKDGTLILSYNGNKDIVKSFYNKKYPEEIFSPENCK